MLLIRNTIRHDRINLQPLTTMETVAVVVRGTQHNDIRIISGYVPPTTPLSETDLEAIFMHMTPTVLLGDLNAKHAAWNCSSNNKAGNKLLRYCFIKGINIYAPDQATYVNSRGHRNVLDIALGYKCTLTTPLSLHELSSDHNPVVCKIHITPQDTNQRLKYDYKQANWTHSDTY